MTEVAVIRGYLAFYFERLDAWYEEDERIEGHPRSPLVRIDVRRSSRRVQVRLRGEVVADSTDARLLFETGHRTRYYLPREDVRMDLLTPSQRRSYCPYKGHAHYWSVQVAGQRQDDLVWSYPDPLPEALPVQDLLCFYEERVDAVLVDGAPASP